MNSNNSNNNPGFKTPKDYFESFDNRLFDKLSLESEPALPKDTGFNLPDNYFENLDKQIIDKVNDNTIKVIPLYRRTKFITYAASIAAVLCIGYFMFNSKSEISVNDIEYASLEQYLTSEDLNLDANDLADVYEINPVDLDDISEYNIENNQLLDYISDEIDSDDYIDNL